jgi:hypothetical protein
MTAPNLTIWDQALINLCGWLACTRWTDDRRDLMLAQTRRVAPNVNHDHPLIGPLAEAAQAVCDAADRPASWFLIDARLRLDQALAAVFMARGAQAMAQLWPDENTDFSAPLPPDPATETPNAAAE